MASNPYRGVCLDLLPDSKQTKRALLGDLDLSVCLFMILYQLTKHDSKTDKMCKYSDNYSK